METRAKVIIGVTVVWLVIGVGLAIVTVLYQPSVTISVQQGLVGPDDAVFNLLISGASQNDIKASVLASGKDVDDIIWRGTSLLASAIEYDRDDVAQWLLEIGADPNGGEPYLSPLAMAVRSQRIELVRQLLSCGADPDRGTAQSTTPRWIASNSPTSSNQEIVELFNEYDKRREHQTTTNEE